MPGATYLSATRTFRLFICAIVIPLLLGTASPANAAEHDKWVKGRVLVQVKAGVSHGHLKKLLTPQDADTAGSISGINTHIITVPQGAEDRVIKALSRHPFVVSAEKDLYVQVTDFTPNDPEYASAWHLQTMNVHDAWGVSRGGGITVAVLDTGVNGAHEDLSGKMVAGRNVVSNNSDTSDIQGHGTKVAGVIGAVMNNSLGVASIAPDVWLMPVRITNDTQGWASSSDIAKGITWAADNGANIANISYESSASTVIKNAAAYMRSKGGMVVVAAGNSGNNQTTADSDSIISVSATTKSDTKASWSNYGNYIDVAAPGVGIWTTNKGGGYQTVSGTSFSTPVTAATIALIMSANPSLSLAEVENVLESSAVDLGAPGFDPEFGNGRIDALAAVLLAGGQAPAPTDTEPPTVAFSSPQNGATVSGIIAVNATATDNTGVIKVELFDDAGLVGTVLSAPYSFSWDSARTGDGSTPTLRLVAYDSKGNTGNQSIIVNVADTTPPVISAPGNKTVEATGTSTSVALGNASATDNVDGTVSVTPDKTGPFPLGNNVITWTASDSSNNTATAKQTITVRDTTPPVVTAPANITVVASGTLTDVALGSATAIDLVDGPLSAVPNKSGPFPVGKTTITWSAIDSANNPGTAIQTLTVTQPDTPPQVNAPANKTVEATGKLTAVNIGTATASDNEDGSLTAIPDKTGPFPLGNTTITWTATDSKGNTATAKQIITVRDTTPPVVTAPADKSVVASDTLTNVALGSATAIDLVDGSLLAVADKSGPFPVGKTTITWSATDSANNSGTAIQTLTITESDSPPPQVTAPANKTVEATGKLTAVNIGTATAVDNEGGNLTATPDNTGPFPLGNTTVTWSAKDAQGNTATATQQITVRDTRAPTLDIPNDISIGASGILTNVDLGKATAFDQVSGNITPQPDPKGPFSSGQHIITWTATDGSGNATPATQLLTVLPRADFSVDQTVNEGKTVIVTVNLSGNAAAYPVVIPYTVTGSANNPLDHNASNGEIRINSGTTGSLSFKVVDDGTNGEPASTVVFSMQSPANAVTGSRLKHTVTISEDNEPPTVSLLVEQQNIPVRTVYPFNGDVVVTADISDPNADDTHSFDWSLTDNRLAPAAGTQNQEFILDPDQLAAGIYTLRVTVSDDGIPSESVSVEIVLNVVATPPPLTSSEDQDGDGSNDAKEGLADSDQDGVDDYLDAISNPSILQGKRGIADKYLLVTEPGLRLSLGASALAAGQGSANVGKSDIEKFGGINGQPGASADDTLEYAGGIFDFMIDGLTEPGESVRIILPQHVALRDGAVYRKYTPDAGWQDFVTDSSNKIASARGSAGVCPAPGDSSYRDGLTTGDFCIQLTLQDGGPNDQDGRRNAVIHDPGAAGSLPQAVNNNGGGGNNATGGSRKGGGIDVGGSGGCTLNPSSRIDPVWLLILLAAGIGIQRRRICK